jgi:predicted HNH restriction endonuclease
MPLKDPEARRAYHREYMRNRMKTNPEAKKKLLARNKRNRDRYSKIAKETVAEWKTQGCSVCGETATCCLVAHHLEPEDKSFTIANVLNSGYSKKRLLEELIKCVCLCANCHAKVHAGLIQIDTP